MAIEHTPATRLYLDSLQECMKVGITIILIPLLLTVLNPNSGVAAVEPKVTFLGTRLVNIDFEQVDLMFDLVVENPNPIAFDIQTIDYALKIDGQLLVRGVTARGITIPKSETHQVSLPITLKFDTVKAAATEIRGQDQLTYQLDSTVKIKLPVIGDYAIPLMYKGTLPVPQLPTVRLQHLQLKSLDLSTAKVLATLDIENPNDFDLGFRDFQYRIYINHQSWAEGVHSEPGHIPRKNHASIPILFTLNLSDMGKTAPLIFGSRQLEYQLLGKITLNTSIALLQNHRMLLDIKGQVRLD